jgi:hypothetical protein
LAFTVTESNARATLVTAPASTNGWVANGACWVVRQGGTC